MLCMVQYTIFGFVFFPLPVDHTYEVSKWGCDSVLRDFPAGQPCCEAKGKHKAGNPKNRVQDSQRNWAGPSGAYWIASVCVEVSLLDGNNSHQNGTLVNAKKGWVFMSLNQGHCYNKFLGKVEHFLYMWVMPFHQTKWASESSLLLLLCNKLTSAVHGALLSK